MKTIKYLFVMVSMFLVLPIGNVSAHELPDNTEPVNEVILNNFSDNIYTSEDYIGLSANDPSLKSATATGILIFFAGVVVGYIVDGAIIYATGQSAGEWVAAGLNWISQPRYPLDQTYSITISQNKVTSYKTLSGNQCYLAPGGNQYSCIYSLQN